MQRLKILFIFLSIAHLGMAQNPFSKKIKGKIVANTSDLEGIYIANLRTNHTTITANRGYFEIEATIGDTLLFSAIQFKGLQFKVEKKDFEGDLLFVKMEPLVHQLDEVVVHQYKNINAVSLGIIPAGQKTYTPAERKLYTATQGSGVVSIDAIINRISGRTAMLKKEIAVEKKELLLDKIEYWFQKEFFTEKLKIPEDYVAGFKYYLVDSEKFSKAIKEKNKTLASFIMSQLATDYLQMIQPTTQESKQ